MPVLIESDWNLKQLDDVCDIANCIVLIESDWNLKTLVAGTLYVPEFVLIESDWNLKLHSRPEGIAAGHCINRIRLEFKANY